MFAIIFVCSLGVSGIHAQAGSLFYDQTTQGLIPWTVGSPSVEEACSNLGQFVVDADNEEGLTLIGNSGEVVSSIHFSGPDPDNDYGSDMFFETELATNAISENYWNPEIANNSHCHILLTDPTFNKVQYNNVEDGIAADPGFECGGGFKAKGKGSSPQSLLDNTNPVLPSDTEWLYWEALPWVGINNQYGLDTLRLFIERFPTYRELVPPAINYMLQCVNNIAEGDSSYEYQPWIDEYNWLVSVFTLDTARWYESNILSAMAESAEFFSRNDAANLSWNDARLFPFDSSTDYARIAAIRHYQKEIPEDTTPFHIIQIPPQPYVSGVAQERIPSDLDFSETPNPAEHSVQVAISAPYECPMSLILYDELGRSVRQLSSGRVNAGDNLFDFDLSDIPAGSYYMRVAAAGQVKTLKVVKE